MRASPAHRRACLPPRSRIAGVDEAGRGPLAGPVFAAAVILDRRRPIPGLADSKKLSAARRRELQQDIERSALAWSVAWCDVAEIDVLNILRATLLAMRRAVLGLTVEPTLVRVDGNRLPLMSWSGRPVAGETVIGGDDKVRAISAASILAKESRDAFMQRVDLQYPQYGFARHKGYGTAVHRDRLAQFGPCPQHRRSFRPVSSMLSNTAR